MKKNNIKKQQTQRPILSVLKENGWILLCISMIIVLLYGGTIMYDFSPFDDYTIIVENNNRFSSLAIVPQYFTSTVFEREDALYYRPLLLFTFLVDNLISSGKPWSFHLTNVLFHIGAVSLLFLLLTLCNTKRTYALLLSLVFAAHPLFVHAVTWIPGINDTLLAILVLLAFVSFNEYVRLKNARFLVFHMIFFALALLAKENAVFIPPIYALYMIFENNERGSLERLVLPIILWGIIGGMWLLMRKYALHGATSVSLLKDFDKKLIEFVQVMIVYIGQLIVPIGQKVYTMLDDVRDTVAWYAIIVFAYMSLIAFCGVKSWKRFFFGWVWYFGFLSLASWVHLSYETNYIETHRLYVPCIGFVLAFSQIDFKKRFGFIPQYIGYGGMILVIALFSVQTVQRSAIYAERNTCLELVSKESPNNWYVAFTRAYVVWKERKYGEAIERLTHAIELNPTHEQYYNYRGVSYLSIRKYRKAIDDFTKAINLKPEARFFRNRGVSYAAMGHFSKASADLTRALEKKPENVKYLCERAEMYYRSGQLEKAREDLMKAANIQKNYVFEFVGKRPYLQKML